MGAAIGSLVRPWRRDFRKLVEALTTHYVHLVHVGVGWAMARVPLARRWFAQPLDPMLAPLALDGRGFHDGYFRTEAVVRGWRALSGPRERLAVYDQGVGRSFWFSGGADPGRIGRAVASLDPERHSDLWAGLGLAAVYAGGGDKAALKALVRAAGVHRRAMRQGAAFALAAHHRSGFVPEDVVDHAEAIAGLGGESLLIIVETSFDVARASLLPPLLRYQLWRRLVIDRIEAGA